MIPCIKGSADRGSATNEVTVQFSAHEGQVRFCKFSQYVKPKQASAKERPVTKPKSICFPRINLNIPLAFGLDKLVYIESADA